MSTTLTTVDQSLRDAVSRQLSWDPQVDAALIGVTTQDGVATLSGYVDTYTAKLAAERAARKVFGVKAVANELEVRLAQTRIDPDIAKDALHALQSHVSVPKGIGVTVRDGHLADRPSGLDVSEGRRRASGQGAARCARVFNQIEVKPTLHAATFKGASSRRCTDTPTSTRDAFMSRRSQARSSWVASCARGPSRTRRVRAAWAAPGVVSVDNRISVVP